MAMTDEMTKFPFCFSNFLFLFDSASFSMVAYGRVVLAIPKQSFMAQLCCHTK